MTAPTSTRRRARSSSTRNDILVAAAGLFAERGFAAVGVQEIGERVGITGGAIYRHFPSKDAVLQAVLQDTIERWVAVAAAESGADVTRLVHASVQLVVEHPGQLATYVRERHRAEPPFRGELARRERELFELWSGAMLAAQPSLSRTDVVVRQQALNGVLSSLALRPAGLAQTRLRALITDGLIAVATAEPVSSGRGSATTASDWAPPTPRREQIIATAMRLFAERGFHGVSMDDIGEAVGMAGPSLYEHVDGKADLLLDAYDRAGAFVVAGAANALVEASSATEALDRLIGAYVQVAFDHVDLLVVTSREGSALPPSERPRLARRRRDLHELWAAVLRELRSDVPPADARVLVRSALALVGAQARQRRGDSPSVEATLGLVRAFLLGGALPHSTNSTEETS